MHKKGFTLAEVLVTLAVIGVVASLTIPNLIQNANDKKYEAQFRKHYSLISSATTSIIEEYGTMQASTSGDNYRGNKLMALYATKLQNLEQCVGGASAGVCYHDGIDSWETLDGGIGFRDYTEYARLQLSTGALLVFNSWSDSCTHGNYQKNSEDLGCGMIVMDINGFKEPNVLGKDIFELYITQHGAVADGAIGTLNHDATNPSNPWHESCDSSSTDQYNGCACAGRLLIEGNMDY